MRRVRCKSMLAAAAMIAALCVPAFAQKVVSSKVGGGGSPHETVEYTIDGAKITINYGKPFLKGRSLETLAPAGQVWRLGADEATIITSDKPLMIGSLMLPRRIPQPLCAAEAGRVEADREQEDRTVGHPLSRRRRRTRSSVAWI